MYVVAVVLLVRQQICQIEEQGQEEQGEWEREGEEDEEEDYEEEERIIVTDNKGKTEIRMMEDMLRDSQEVLM